jgi:hypothetical protein
LRASQALLVWHWMPSFKNPDSLRQSHPPGMPVPRNHNPLVQVLTKQINRRLRHGNGSLPNGHQI